MSLAAPLWLAALGALLLPLLLHLLSRGRAHRQRLGSVRLLPAGAVRQPRRLALRQPLLLLVRCALLAVVALALAAPRVPAAARATATPRPWLLVEPGLTAALPAVALAPAASGGQAPEERWLAPGLPTRSRAEDSPSFPDLAAVPGGAWSLLREADALAPPGAELRVVSSGRLAALAGDRPTLARPVRWSVVPDPRTDRWLEGARATATGVTLVVGESGRERSVFRTATIGVAPAPVDAAAAAGALAAGGGGAPLASEPGLTLAVEGERLRLRLPAGDPVAADDELALPAGPTSLPAVLIADAGRQADARYLEAALRAAAETAGVTLELRRELPAAGPAPALAVWLGEAPVPAALLAAVRGGAVLVTDRGRPEEACGGSFQATAATGPIALRRCAARAATGGTGWTSDRGRPVLRVERLGAGTVWQLQGRFHPAWSDLVLSAGLPAWLLERIASVRPAPSAAVAATDRRGDGGQGAPAVSGHAAARPAPTPPSRRPELALWACVPLLMVAERWLAGRGR